MENLETTELENRLANLETEIIKAREVLKDLLRKESELLYDISLAKILSSPLYIKKKVDSEFADVYPLKFFIDACKLGVFGDDDGEGLLMVNPETETDVCISPSQILELEKRGLSLDPLVTHISWYNK